GVADLPPATVVADDARQRQPEADRRLQLDPVEPEGAVPGNEQYPARRLQQLGRDRERRAHTEAPERPWVKPLAGAGETNELGGATHDVAAVADDQRVRRDVLGNLGRPSVVRDR